MAPARGSPKEARDDESEVASAAFCRICLSFEPGGELISPCMCKGTQQFVHRSCLDHWRSVKVGTAFSQCTTCKAQFHLRVQFLTGDRCRKMKYQLFVATDILLVFLAIQTVITAISGVAYLLDKDGKFRNNFANDWVPILSKHPMPFYYCTGVVVFFALVGLVGLILNCLTWPTTNNHHPGFASSSNHRPGFASSSNHRPGFASSSNHARDSSEDSSPEVVIVFVVIIFVFFILGIVYAYVAATIAVQRILQRHYHILIKKDLTKEYIVEDLQGVYTPPKMNPEHEQHLKMLQLM